MMVRRHLSVLARGALVVSAIGGPSIARAANVAPAQLDYAVADGIGGCPDIDELRGSVATRLGYDPFREDAKRRVTARIARAGSAVRGDIELYDEGGELRGSRSLRAERCGELATSMAFAISMAIDPVRTLVPQPQPQPAASPSADSRAPKASEASRKEPAPPLRQATPFTPRVHAAVGAGALGLAAGVSSMLAVGAGLRYGSAAIDLEGRFMPASVAEVEGGRVRTSTLGISVLPCAYIDPMFVCTNVTVGALQGKAEGVDTPQSATTMFAQAGGRLGVVIRLMPRATLDPFVEALATLTRTHLNFRGREVWSTSALGVQGGVRLAVHFP